MVSVLAVINSSRCYPVYQVPILIARSNPVSFDPPSYESSVGLQSGSRHPLSSSSQHPLRFPQPPPASALPEYRPVTPNTGFAPQPVQTHGTSGMTLPALGPAYPPYAVQYPPNNGRYPQLAVNPGMHTRSERSPYDCCLSWVVCIIVGSTFFIAIMILVHNQGDGN